MPLRVAFPFPTLALLLAAARAAAADAPLEARFVREVRPFLETYCLECHAADKPEAELDLSPFKSTEAVIAGFAHWEIVLERLEAADMPPTKAKQHPTDATRAAIVTWIHDLQRDQAARHAGDPGPVLARRLSNAEFDYTIQDLTGVDLRPTKEFPVDPANQAGFDNTGESLAMSPALLKKYLGAARTIADHLVLKPDGFEFAAHPVIADTDRDKWAVLRIVEFYKRQPTDLADYFAAAWRYHHRPQRDTTLATIASDAKVSARYLDKIYAALTTPEDVGPLAKLQSDWLRLPAPGSPSLRAACEQLRDSVVGLRTKLIPEVKNLTGPGQNNGSQTLVLWKNRQMAANRRTYDRTALYTPGASAQNPEPNTQNSKSKTHPQPSPENPYAPPPTPNPALAATGPAPATASKASISDRVRRGGKFLAPAITTTGSSATFAMAAARKRGTDPDLAVPADPAARARHEAAFARFADLFPDAFYISERARVYLDAQKETENAGRLLSAGLHSMTGYFRDDQPLYDLILDDAGRRELDRLWREFDYVSSVPQRMHVSFVWFERTDSSFMRDPEFDLYRPEDKSVIELPRVQKLGELYLAKAQRNNAPAATQAAIREHFEIVAANLARVEALRPAAEASHLAELETFAARAYRRPLTGAERTQLRAFYQTSRVENGLPHEDAVRDCIVAVLMSPKFNYRIDLTEAAAAAPSSASPSLAAPLSPHALASRLSYFLWSSLPDADLLAAATTGELAQPAVLSAHARRMLRDPRARRFVTEFAGHWLDFRRFEEHNSVDRERYPSFDSALRTAMFEEPVRFLVDLIQRDAPVLECLYADHTFVNAPLARHYGLPELAAQLTDDTWHRLDHARAHGRGGLLPMSVFLTANSPGLRTSPVKRGYWVVRRVLGERIPPPPPVVPELPADEAKLAHLTLREALAKHREDPSCAACHARFDSYGLVFENYGAVGERRTVDFAGRPVDTRAEFPGNREAAGLDGLTSFIRQHREKDFVDNLCRKLLAYALGRSLIISDNALVEEMKSALAAREHRFSALIDTIVTSRQFTHKRTPSAANVSSTSQ